MQVRLQRGVQKCALLNRCAVAAETYLESADMPLIDKDASNAVVYQVPIKSTQSGYKFVFDLHMLQGGDKWTLESNGKAIKNYDTSDLRMTIVYRCCSPYT